MTGIDIIPGLLSVALYLLLLIAGLRVVLTGSASNDATGVRQLAQRLEGGRLTEPAGFLSPVIVSGTLEGREVILLAERTLSYRVRVRHGLGDVVLKRAELRARLAQLPERSAQARETGAALQHLVGTLGIQGVSLSADGWLAVTRPRSVAAVRCGALLEVLRQLVRLAPLFETRVVQLEVLGEATARAWTAGGEDLLCPYCRDGLQTEAEDLTACPDCRTVHHSACFGEAGGCTVFGCAGGAARGRSVRA